MPEILSLAPELQLMIIANIPLNDIEALTLSCKALHQLSKKRLIEQYARKRSFFTIAVGHLDNKTWDEDPQIRGVHPLVVLRDLFADPPAWLYTKTLLIGNMEKYATAVYDDPEEAELDDATRGDVAAEFEDDPRLLTRVMDVKQYIRPVRGEPNYHRYANAERWTRAILSGDMEAAASLLIAMLPNLQKVRLVDRFQYMSNSFFLATLEKLLRAAVTGKRNYTGINSFSKLTEVGLHGAYDESGANYGVFQGFMALPSMRTIKGRVIDGGERILFRRCFDECSEVTKLEFYQSSIHAASFERTLCTMLNLETFIYNFWARAPLDEPMWEPRQIVEVLEIHTSETLRHLELTHNSETERTTILDVVNIEFDEGEPFIGPLCGFEVLETIRLETMMLYKEIKGTKTWTPGETQILLLKLQESKDVERTLVGGRYTMVEPLRLVDVLPLSTRRLRLVGGLSSKDAAAMLEGLPDLKDDLLPNISSIYFEDVERGDFDYELVRKCEDAGVKMKFWRHSAQGA